MGLRKDALPEDLWIELFIILIFVAFISGLFLGAAFSRGRKAREPWYGRHITAKGGLGRDGKVRSANLLAFAIAFVVGLVVLDHFTGPLFPDVFYSGGGRQCDTP
jgi:hypothetical protein